MTQRAILDSWGNVVTWVEQSRPGEMVIRQRSDETALLRETAYARSQPNRGSLRRVGSVDPTITLVWLKEDGISPAAFGRKPMKEQLAYFRRKLNDSDYSKLRTSEKRMDFVGG